jgi:hypothetical protein
VVSHSGTQPPRVTHDKRGLLIYAVNNMRETHIYANSVEPCSLDFPSRSADSCRQFVLFVLKTVGSPVARLSLETNRSLELFSALAYRQSASSYRAFIGGYLSRGGAGHGQRDLPHYPQNV